MFQSQLQTVLEEKFCESNKDSNMFNGHLRMAGKMQGILGGIIKRGIQP